MTDTPMVFGLHSNADITYQTKSAKDILDTILSVQPKASGGGSGETREDVVYKMADDMLSKLPKDYISYEVNIVRNILHYEIDLLCVLSKKSIVLQYGKLMHKLLI